MKNEKTRKIIQKEEKMGERRFSTKNRFVSFLLAIAMVLTLLPIGAVQAKAEGSRQIIMHFKNSTNWEAVYTKIAEGKSWTAVDGYGYANSWPGAEVEEDSENEGWYSFTISTNSDEEFHCIFNNKGNGKQTDNIGFTENGSKVEKWVTGEKGETVISEKKPEGWTESTSSAPVKPVIKVQSPVVNEDRTVTFNLDATGEYKDAEDVRLMGTVAGTNWDNGLSMEKEGDKFTVTVQKQNPGIYGYKYKIGTSWITDPANDAMTDGNSRLVVPGLESKNMEALAGKDLELPKTLKLYGDDGTSSDETVSYTLKDPSLSDKVTLKDETINVKKGSGIKTVELTATAGNETSDVIVNVVEKQYKVTIYMYSPDFEMKAGVSDVYIYNKKGAEKEFVPLNNTIEDTENNVTWLQGTTYVSFNSLGIIGKPVAGSTSWNGQDGNRYYVIDEKESEVTLWYVFGKTPVTENLPLPKKIQDIFIWNMKMIL
jgi:pullulanase family protein